MSLRQQLQQYVMQNPGQPLRVIAAGVGLTDRASITSAGAQLSQLARAGKLRAAPQPGYSTRFTYYPTATTGVDGRVPSPEEAARRQQARARRHAEAQAASRSRRLTAAQRAAFHKGLQPTPPAPRARGDLTIVRKPLAAPKTRFAPTAEPETVEQWMARTGKQPERLPPTACSKQLLRFDHSDNPIPTGKRRPALRRRGSINI